MGEVREHVWHRFEAERLSRLADLSPDPALRPVLARMAERHCRIAEQIEALRGRAGTRPQPSQSGDGRHSDRAYQLCLMKSGSPELSQTIEAESDIAALRVAFFVQAACSDVYPHFELWHGRRLIVRSRDGRGAKRPTLRAEEVSSRTQESLVRTEEALLNSAHAIAESRNLLEATARLRVLVRRAQPVTEPPQVDVAPEGGDVE